MVAAGSPLPIDSSDVIEAAMSIYACYTPRGEGGAASW
jgi:hypothetical protein